MVGVVLGLLVLALDPLLALVFTRDAAVRDELRPVLVAVAIMQPLGGVVFVLDGILIGAGDVRYLALAMAVATLCFVPCAVAVLATGAGLIALVERAVRLHVRPPVHDGPPLPAQRVARDRSRPARQPLRKVGLALEGPDSLVPPPRSAARGSKLPVPARSAPRATSRASQSVTRCRVRRSLSVPLTHRRKAIQRKCW